MNAIRKLPATLLAALIFLVPGVSHKKLFGQDKIDNSLFWEVSGNGLQKPSYLFGTYHLLTSSYLETVPKVKSAFEKAHGVVVETELDSVKMMRMTYAMVMKDKSISDLLSKEDYSVVAEEVLKSTGVTLDMMGQFKPNFITLMLTIFYNQQYNSELLGKYHGLSIDSYFATEGQKQGKAFATFETIEEQLKILFDYDSYETQAKQLLEFVKTKDDMIQAQRDLTRLYLAQDLAGMFKLYTSYSEQFGDTSYLLDDRNIKWMSKLPGMLEKGNQFIAVGALHFTGEKSLIKLLREKGYKVKALPVK